MMDVVFLSIITNIFAIRLLTKLLIIKKGSPIILRSTKGKLEMKDDSWNTGVVEKLGLTCLSMFTNNYQCWKIRDRMLTNSGCMLNNSGNRIDQRWKSRVCMLKNSGSHVASSLLMWKDSGTHVYQWWRIREHMFINVATLGNACLSMLTKSGSHVY